MSDAQRSGARCRTRIRYAPWPSAATAVASATGCEDGAARIWQLGSDSSIGQPLQHSDFVRDLAARPDGKAIATVSQDGVVWLWDTLTMRLIAKQQGHESGRQFDVVFNRAGTVLISAAHDATVRLWNGATLAPIGAPSE